MLPDDYPDDFTNAGLLDVWFRDIPWRIQSAVMGVNPSLRCIRNPATAVFVLVMKLRPEDPSCRAPFPFFGTADLVGWFPMLETQPGQPVEAVYRICEGMKMSAAFFDEHYGESPESISATIRGDRDAAEKARVDAMLESTAFASRFARELQMKQLAMTVSDAKGARLYDGSRKEFQQELEHRGKAKPFSLVTP